MFLGEQGLGLAIFVVEIKLDSETISKIPIEPVIPPVLHRHPFLPPTPKLAPESPALEICPEHPPIKIHILLNVHNVDNRVSVQICNICQKTQNQSSQVDSIQLDLPLRQHLHQGTSCQRIPKTLSSIARRRTHWTVFVGL